MSMFNVQHPSPSCTGAGSSQVMIWSPVPVTCPVEFPAGHHNPWYSLDGLGASGVSVPSDCSESADNDFSV